MNTQPKTQNQTEQTNKRGLWKFILGAAIGAFLFLIPIPTGEYGIPNIPIGIAVDWLNGALRESGTGTFTDIRLLLAYIFVMFSFVMTLFTAIFKPKFIMNNEKLKGTFVTGPLYFVTRLVAALLMTMTIFDFGPAFIIDRWDGAGLMVFDLITGLTTIFLLLSIATPLLTDFGLMEFVGVVVRRVVKALFTLPGRGSVDLAASWFGSSAVGVMITKGQHEKGFYTGREAAVIMTNFALVSIPFSFIIADTAGVAAQFPLWYLIIAISCILLAIIMPRVWPLRSLDDNYLPGVTVKIDEEVEAGESRFKKAISRASVRASKATIGEVAGSAFDGWRTAFFDLFPVIVAWGSIAIIINSTTPIFDIIATPMRLILDLFNVAGAAEAAPATLIGFIDMFLPALTIGDLPFLTRFIISALSIVQIIYLAETGALILKSRVPLGLGKLFALFIMRTLIALPIIIGLAKLFYNAGWIG